MEVFYLKYDFAIFHTVRVDVLALGPYLVWLCYYGD